MVKDPASHILRPRIPSSVRHLLLAVSITGLPAAATCFAECGQDASPYGINAHAPQGPSLDVLLDEVQAAGIDWIRVDFNWIWVETSKGVYNWTIYDNIAAAAAARDLRIFATLAFTPPWATSGPPQTGVPDNPADWYDFCFQAVQRYPDTIRHWGLWNEPNLPQFWSGTRQQYIDIILKNGADAVHAANPDAKVVGPTTSHLGSSQWYFWLRDAILEAGDRLDIVSHNVYHGSTQTEVTNRLNATTTFGGNPSLWTLTAPSVREVLQYTGWYGQPFWLTETGWQSGSVGEAQQAAFYTAMLTDWFTGHPNRSWIDRIFFYELNDTQAFPSLSWGILGQDPAFPRKPAYFAYRDFITANPPPPALPGKAGEPSPADEAAEVGFNVSLSWIAGCEAVSHQLYFGTSSPGSFQGTLPGTSFNAGPLEPMTTYYWRVDSVNTAGTTTGDVWRFTTRAAPGDFDGDGDVDQSDFGFLQACYTQLPAPPAGDCLKADLNANGIVDQSDVDLFQQCMSGSRVPADPTCSE